MNRAIKCIIAMFFVATISFFSGMLLNLLPLYSFMSLSDVHIGYENASENFERALLIAQKENLDFVTVCGDISANNEQNVKEFGDFKRKYSATLPIFAVSGNHDTDFVDTELWKENVANELYYSFEHKNDIFLFVGVSTNIDSGTNTSFFTEEEIKWLEQMLEQNKEKRVFVIQHFFVENTCGNYENLYKSGVILPENHRFSQLIQKYENVIFISGHSHFSLQLGSEDEKTNIYQNTATYLHNGPLTAVRKGDGSVDYNSSEGAFVDVYSDKVVFRGYDFINNREIKNAKYEIRR